jgi:hypothetical protein
MNMNKGRTSIVHRSFLQTNKDFLKNKQIFNGKATTNPLLFMSPSINDNYDPKNQKYVKAKR